MIDITYNTVSGQNLIDKYKIHYDFKTYNSSAGSNFIYNDASNLFSGKVYATSSSSDPTDPFDYFTGNGNITGQGVFSGGLNDFYHHINIQENDQLNTGVNNDFLFLVAAESTTKQDIGEEDKGPVKNDNILFSNLSGSGNLYYGWQFGINASNRGYIETYDSLKPKTLTYSNVKTPFGHNIWAFMHRGDELSVGLFDIKDEAFIFSSCPVKPASFTTGGYWNIGSGLNYETRVFTDQISQNSGTFAGRISEFIYFDGSVSNEQAALVAKSIYSDSYINTASISEVVASGFTGFSTGSFNTEYEIGYFPEIVTNSTVNETLNFSKKQPLTGNIQDGEIEYQFFKTVPHEISGTENIYKAVYHTGLTITGVTGFENVSYSSGISRPLIEYGDSNELGDTTGTTYTALTGDTYTSILSQAVSGISGHAPELFRPNQLSFIYKEDDDNFICEICRSDTFEMSNKNALNNYADYKNSELHIGRSIFLNHLTGAEFITLYIDGKGYESGDLSVNDIDLREVITYEDTNETFVLTTSGLTPINLNDEDSDEYRNLFRSYNIQSGDFVLSGLEVLDQHVWNGTRGIDLNGIYDLYQPTQFLDGPSRWEVTGSGDFIANPNSIFDSNDDNQFLFFNGQKLISGIDYDNQFSEWNEYISGESSGTFFFRPNVSDRSITGTSGNIDAEYYWPNGNIIYFNGIRQNYNKYFVENTSTKDLISGVKTFTKNTNTLYNS